MNMRSPSLIHNLTFDISCAGVAGDGLAMADWIKEALLPVMEEVFDRHDRPGRIRRIAQLEIDLGTVSREESRGELARRLFAQLSGALEASLEDATHVSLVEEREQQSGAHLLDFLRTGRLDWTVAADGRVAHRQLLQRVLASSRAAEVLRTAINDPRMLARLLRQFDAADVNSVAQLLSRSWPERERGPAFAGDVAAGDKEAYWRRLLQTGARPPAERRYRDGLLQLAQMPNRHALREIWRRMLDEVRQRIGKRSMSALTQEAMTDLGLILRPRAHRLFAEQGGKWRPSQIDTVLQLLLAGEDAIAAVTMMLADPSEQLPATLRQRSNDEVNRQAAPRHLPNVVAANGVTTPSIMSPPAGADAIAASRSTLASPSQPAEELLTRAWRTFSPEQRTTFQYIWQRLSEALADLAGGRDVATLAATQKFDLALILQPQAAALMKELGRQDETHLVETVVQLLLVDDDASTNVQAMFSNVSDPLPAIETAGRHEQLAPEASHRISPSDPNAAKLRAVIPSHWGERLPAKAGTHAELMTTRPMDSRLRGNDDSSVYGRKGLNLAALPSDPQKSLALLTRLWRAFSIEQRAAFDHIWRRLSEEVAGRTAGRGPATLTVAQRSDLALILQTHAVALMKELELPDETSLVESAVQLLLASDDASAAVQAMFASAGARLPSIQSTAREDQSIAEMNHDTSSPEPTRHLSLLARAWEAFSPDQREVFGHIWRRLSEELASRATGRDVATLPVAQKAGLALNLKSQAAALLIELGHQDETHLVDAVVQLLLADDNRSTAVGAMFTNASDWTIATNTAAGHVQRDVEQNHRISSPNPQASLALLAHVWATLSVKQRIALHRIWQRLSEEVGSRDVATLNAAQRSELALIVRPQAATLLKELGHQDETHLVDAVVQLLLAGDETSIAVQAMFTSASDQIARRERLDAEANHRISSPDPQKSLALPARAWEAFSPQQRSVFSQIWRRLSEEFVSRAPGRDLAMLPVAQRSDLALIMRPLAAKLLKELEHRNETHLVDAVVQLLLAGDETSIAVEAMFTSASDTLPAIHTAARHEQLDAEMNHAVPSPDPQKSLALLTWSWGTFSSVQRAAFGQIWERLVEEVSDHAGGRDLATLTATQKSDLATILKPRAAALVKDLWHRDEGHLAEAVVQLLLAGDDASAAARTVSADASTQTTATQNAAWRGQLDAEANPRIASPDFNDAKLSAVIPAHAGIHAEPMTKRLMYSRVREKSFPPRGGNDGSSAYGQKELNFAALSPDPQKSLALLARLSGGSRAGGSKLVTLDATQKIDLATLANPTDQLPVALSERRSLVLPVQAAHVLNAEQRTTFASIGQRLEGEAAGRVGAHDTATPIASQQSELASALLPRAAARKEPGLEAQNVLAESQATPASTPIAEPLAAIDPSLAAFRDWQQGRLDIVTLTIVLPDLRQWINWWLLHDPQQVNQDCSLMLEAIDAQMQQVADPILFMKLVLVSLKTGGVLDLDALSRQAGPAHGNEHAMPLAPIASPVPPGPTLSFANQQTHLDDLNSAQLHQIIRAKIQRQGDGPSLFLEAIEAYAQRAASVPAFFLKVLQRLICDQPVDLEQLLADTDCQTPPPAGDINAPIHEQAVAPPIASALPEQLRQVLPQRLANAMLQADLASLAIIWPEITRAHTTELAAAAQRYLSRADLRTRLIEHTGTDMLKDLLAALSPSAARLIEPILSHSEQYSSMLPTRLSAHEFEQRVLRYAYEQALKPDISPTEWLHALISSVQEMHPDQRKQLEHAWYEVLRAEKKPASLLTVLEQTLFEPSTKRRGAPEPAASLLLMRQVELDATDHASLTSLLKNIGNETDGSLESALFDPQALARLADLSPTPVLARVFAMLKPKLAAQLPALLRQLQKALPISLAPVPATLDRRIWRAIYQAAFAAAGPEDFLPTMVTRLASQYRQDDPGAWLEKIAGVTTTTPTSPPDQALAQLLQPWAEQKTETPVRKPTPAKRSAEEAEPLTGESNIHNAGMMIIAPYIQRLFSLLDLTVDGKFVSDDAAQRGVHLLQYAVTGEESTPEYQLVLNKLLCGINGGVPIVAGISITDKEKTTIEQMLTGVITHWSALGSTSIAGLRETFLQRQGHLYFQEDAWQLKIPTKTFDMLLDRLPWSFAMTKMPWMAQPLHVTWRCQPTRTRKDERHHRLP